MSAADELNPNSTGMTTKEVLLEVRADVKAMSGNLSILLSQNLDSRLNEVESWKDRVNGRVNVLVVLVGVLASLVGILAGLGSLYLMVAK